MTAIKGVAVRPNAVMRRMRCLFFVVFYLKGEDIMDIAETTKIVVEKVADILVETPMGDLTVRPVHSEDYPGIEVFLRREDTDQDLLLALVECVRDETDLPQEPNLITRVYGQAMDAEYTTRVVHEGIEDFFKVEEPEDKGTQTVFIVALESHEDPTAIEAFSSKEQAVAAIRSAMDACVADLKMDGDDPIALENAAKTGFSVYVPDSSIRWDWVIHETKIQEEVPTEGN